MGFVLLMGGFSLRQYLQSRHLQSRLESEYRRTLSELTASAVSLEESLTLLRYAAAPQQTVLHAEMASRQSADIAYLLGRLPLSAPEAEKVVSAFARIEGWTDALFRQSSASNSVPHESHTAVLPQLVRAVRVCSEVLTEWERASLDGTAAFFFEKSPSAAEEGHGATVQGLQRMASELEKLPPLFYEGIDFETSQEPHMLRNLPEISEGEALRAALDFTGLEEGQLRLLRRTGGKLPCYGIGGHLDGGEISLEITCRGGMVLSMMNSRKAEEKTLPLETAQKNAESFLKSRGYDGMVYCGVADREDILLLQYVYAQDGILCYPDLIQIGTAADTGKIVSFESSGYLMHHIPHRETAPPTLSEREAVSALHPDLQVEALSRCIILSAAQQELFCYQAVCRTEDGKSLVFYINADTGELEQTERYFYD